MTIPRKFSLSVALAGSLLLAACGGRDVYADVAEGEANEMVAALLEAGIEADKAPGEKGTFTVQVAEGDFAEAVAVLRDNGLPREKYESLGTVFKKEGFSSSSLSEKARLTFGLSQELERTVSEYDGVVAARVHLAMPDTDPLTGTANPSSASVFVKYRPGFDLRSQTAAIKALVTNSIEGLNYDNVSVVMVEAKTAPPRALDSGETAGGALLWFAGGAGALLLAWSGWLALGRRRRGAGAGGLTRADRYVGG